MTTSAEPARWTCTCALRAKLGAEHEALIGTVRNVGYRFVPAKGADEGRAPRAARPADREPGDGGVTEADGLPADGLPAAGRGAPVPRARSDQASRDQASRDQASRDQASRDQKETGAAPADRR